MKLGGRFVVGERVVGELSPFRAGAEDEVRVVELEADLAPGAQELRVDTRAGRRGRETFLRIKRITVGDPGTSWSQAGGAS